MMVRKVWFFNEIRLKLATPAYPPFAEMEELTRPLTEITEEEILDADKVDHFRQNVFFLAIWYIHQAACHPGRYLPGDALMCLMCIIMSNIRIAEYLSVNPFSFATLDICAFDIIAH